MSRKISTPLRPGLTLAGIARTLDYIKSVPPSALAESETRDIKVPAGERTERVVPERLLLFHSFFPAHPAVDANHGLSSPQKG